MTIPRSDRLARTAKVAAGTLAAVLLQTACTVAEKAPEAPAPQTLGQKVADETLKRAQVLYDAGDYRRVIATLHPEGASPFAATDLKMRLEAMKLEAFSHCLLDQLPECRGQFQAILQADPSFQLSVAERKHPTWGPAYDWARRNKR